MVTSSVVSSIDNADSVLTYLATVNNALSSLYDIADALILRDRVAAIQYLTKKLDLDRDVKNRATESMIRTDRRLGELLLEIPKNRGTVLGGNIMLPPGHEQTYSELGIDKMAASRAQTLARIPVERLDSFIDDALGSGRELTVSGAYKYAKNVLAQKPHSDNCAHSCTLDVIVGDMVTVVPSLGKFDLIIADPPSGSAPQIVIRWIEVCKNALADNYHMFWFCEPEHAADAEIIMRDLGLAVQSRIVCHSRHTRERTGNFSFDRAWQMVLHCGNCELNPEHGDVRLDVQIHDIPASEIEHPEQKPYNMIRNLVQLGTRSGDRVLDPFAGSGTTGTVCKNYRDCVLIECNAGYVDMIKRRFSEQDNLR
jgi:hypothetical protein